MSDILLDVKMDENVMEIDVDTNENVMEIDVNTDENVMEVELVFQEGISVNGTDDYEKLKNLPKLDGRIIIGNINELDPNVPGYVKDGKAVNEDNVGTIGVLDVKRIWDSVFNK